jgi:hypothetical protein
MVLEEMFSIVLLIFDSLSLSLSLSLYIYIYIYIYWISTKFGIDLGKVLKKLLISNLTVVQHEVTGIGKCSNISLKHIP